MTTPENRLSPRLLLALRAIRACGPCSNARLARALGATPDWSIRTLKELRARGLAARLGDESYDVTTVGRAYLESPPEPPEPEPGPQLLFEADR